MCYEECIGIIRKYEARIWAIDQRLDLEFDDYGRIMGESIKLVISLSVPVAQRQLVIFAALSMIFPVHDCTSKIAVSKSPLSLFCISANLGSALPTSRVKKNQP